MTRSRCDKSLQELQSSSMTETSRHNSAWAKRHRDVDELPSERPVARIDVEPIKQFVNQIECRLNSVIRILLDATHAHGFKRGRNRAIRRERLGAGG